MSRSEGYPNPRGPRALAVLIVLCVAGGSLVELRRFEVELRRGAARELAAAAAVKVAEVGRWREERLSDGREIATSQLVARAVSRSGRGSPSDRADVAAWCASAASHHDEYDAAVVFDASGEKLAAAGSGAGAVTRGEHLAGVLRDGKVILSGLHHGEEGKLHVDLVAPLPLRADGAVTGYVVLRVDAAVHLVPALQASAGRPTGEVLLVQRPRGDDLGLVVSAREGGASALAPEESADPLAVRVSRGESGPLEGLDRRGRRVLAAAQPVPDSNLAVLVEEDERELLAPWRERAVWLLLLGASVAAAVVSATQLWWRRQLETFRRAQYEDRLRRLALERHFAHLTRHSYDLLLLLDGGLRIVEANDRALEAYGYERAEILGSPVRDLLAPQARSVLQQRLLGLEAGGGEAFEARHLRRDGTEFPVEMNARVIEVEGERYYQSVIRDVTDRKRMEEALQASEARLQLAVESSGLGIWDWSAARDVLRLSPNLLEALGYGADELVGAEAITRLLHPDDRAATASRRAALLRGAAALLEVEVRILARSGEWKRFHSRTRVVERDAAGHALRVVGTLAQPTERKRERPSVEREDRPS